MLPPTGIVVGSIRDFGTEKFARAGSIAIASTAVEGVPLTCVERQKKKPHSTAGLRAKGNSNVQQL